MLTFIVYGTPQPAGSKKAFQVPSTGRIVVTEDNRRAKPWKQEVIAAARDEMTEDWTPLEGPLRLMVEFFLLRPRSHYGTGRNEGTIKPSAPTHPTVKPDTTKLLRAVEDAMTEAGVWRDDSQVVAQHVFKNYASYGSWTGAIVKVEPR